MENENSKEFTPLICPQCGSQDIELVSGTGVGKCRSCGTQIIIPSGSDDDGGDEEDDVYPVYK